MFCRIDYSNSSLEMVRMRIKPRHVTQHVTALPFTLSVQG